MGSNFLLVALLTKVLISGRNVNAHQISNDLNQLVCRTPPALRLFIVLQLHSLFLMLVRYKTDAKRYHQ